MSQEPARERGCALVTGASRGIGAAIARGLAADGWPVGVAFHADNESAEAVADAICEAGGRAQALGADVTVPDEADRLCSQLEQAMGLPILVLVNNAATVADDLLVWMDEESWQTVIDTNLTAAFRLSRRALRSMWSQGFGRIVNVASVVGQIANPGQGNYAASKAGLVAMTKTLAVEVAPRSVTVNAIAPGVIDTEATRDQAGSLRKAVPAGRAGTPEEVAACARFLASEQAGYVTGALLTVDGGLTA